MYPNSQPPYDKMPQPQQSAPQQAQSGGAPQQPPQFYAAQPEKSFHWVPIVAIVLFALLFIVAGSFAIRYRMQYQEASTNLNAKEDKAALKAQKKQSDADEAKFAEREKQPYQQFAGPDNYGRVTFQYPKTWSVYVANDAQSDGGTYQAYLNPGVVPPTANTDTQKFALRVTIEQTDLTTVLGNYQGQIENGKLKTSSVSVNGHDGTRLDGMLTDQIRGSAVIFQIRDKILTIRTDANTFGSDFNKLVKTIDFNN